MAFLSCERHELSLQHVPTFNIENMADRTAKGCYFICLIFRPHKTSLNQGLEKLSYGGPQLSRQNQKPHGKNKIPHGKTKNLTAKPNTSQQKQNSFGFAVGICFCREVFGFCCEVFGFAVRSLVLP